jgi:hypothetical protein
MIKRCYPKIESTGMLPNEEDLPQVFEKFYSTMREINNNYVPIKKLRIVKFWSDLFSLVSKMDRK